MRNLWRKAVRRFPIKIPSRTRWLSSRAAFSGLSSAMPIIAMIIVRGVLTTLPILLHVGRILKCPCLSDTLYSINIPATLIVDKEVQPERGDQTVKDYSLVLPPNVRKHIVTGIRGNAAIQFGKIIAHSSQSFPNNVGLIIVEILYTEKGPFTMLHMRPSTTN